MDTLINNLTAGQITGGIAILAAILASIFEVSKIEINPWSSLFGYIGRAINKDVIDKVDALEKQVIKIQEDADAREAKADERDANAARARILRFGDECLHDVKHSKEHFDEIMRDIKDYETYCDTHPHFENNTAVHTIDLINEIYHDRMRDHSFL